MCDLDIDSLVDAVERNAELVIENLGADVKSDKRAKLQAKRIADFVGQWLTAESMLKNAGLDMISIVATE